MPWGTTGECSSVLRPTMPPASPWKRVRYTPSYSQTPSAGEGDGRIHRRGPDCLPHLHIACPRKLSEAPRAEGGLAVFWKQPRPTGSTLRTPGRWQPGEGGVSPMRKSGKGTGSLAATLLPACTGTYSLALDRGTQHAGEPRTLRSCCSPTVTATLSGRHLWSS